MKRVITFLGARQQTTTYLYGDQKYVGDVFPVALRQIVNGKFDQMLVFDTALAHQNCWSALQSLGDPRIEEVLIPDGRNETEIWQIFDTVVSRVDEGDSVIFDITHALRSIPFLVFLFAAYLKTAKKVTIDAIYYGALELKGDESAAPVIDLSEFAGMLDWITAADQFVRTGDARRLARLLDPQSAEQPDCEKAKTPAAKLTCLSQAAFLCQPRKLAEEARDLEETFEQASSPLSDSARPFALVKDQVISAFKDLAADDPQDPQEFIAAEYRMIEWYFDRGHVIQALSLAREWLIDAVTVRLCRPLDYNRSERSAMEEAVSGLARIGRTMTDEESGEKREFTAADLNGYGRIIKNQWPEADRLGSLWNELGEARNRLDHAEHQNSVWSLETIYKKSGEIRGGLRTLAEEWGILPDRTQTEVQDSGRNLGDDV